MVTIVAPAATTSPWRAALTLILAADWGRYLGVAQLDLGLVGQRAGVFGFAAGRVHGAGGDVCQQLVGTGLAQRRPGGSDVLAWLYRQRHGRPAGWWRRRPWPARS